MATYNAIASFTANDGSTKRLTIRNIKPDVSAEQANALLDGISAVNGFGANGLVYYLVPQSLVVTTSDSTPIVQR
ncbi:DUF2922 family protein [Lacticaseibacillus jixiensis]|uniref:DUF2922 family protein n=1 Tax=Lacticaseibacillus jixiensis TaxID=3231926 RepID=UPI0036F2B949